MAYCEQCGAYIPDGQTKCLACGYDESEKPKGNAAAAYAEKKDYSGSAAFDSEKLRRQLEEQREKQKENSRRWAEAEHARREQQGIAWQEGEEHQARFDEHDQEQRGVDPNRTQGDDPSRNGGARILQQPHDEVHKIHTSSSARHAPAPAESRPYIKVSRIGKGARQRSLMAASSRT